MNKSNNSKNVLIIAVSVGLILIAALAVFFVWQNREKEETENTNLETTSEEIPVQEDTNPSRSTNDVQPDSENTPQAPVDLPIIPVPPIGN